MSNGRRQEAAGGRRSNGKGALFWANAKFSKPHNSHQHNQYDDTNHELVAMYHPVVPLSIISCPLISRRPPPSPSLTTLPPQSFYPHPFPSPKQTNATPGRPHGARCAAVEHPTRHTGRGALSVPLTIASGKPLFSVCMSILLRQIPPASCGVGPRARTTQAHQHSQARTRVLCILCSHMLVPVLHRDQGGGASAGTSMLRSLPPAPLLQCS